MTTTTGFVDFYDLLEIPAGAGDEQVRKAIREQRRVWNRRAGFADPERRAEAAERIRRLAEAERVLLDPAQRGEFDARRTQALGHVVDARPRPRPRPAAAEAATAPAAAASGPSAAAPVPPSRHAAAVLAQARQLLGAGRLDEARDMAAAATAAAGHDAAAWDLRASVSQARGNLDDAVYEAGEAARLAPQDAVRRYRLGETLAAREEWRPALQEFEAAAVRAPADPRYRVAVAKALLQLEQPGLALEVMEGVARSYPDEPEHRYYLAFALRAACQSELALREDGTRVIASPAQIEVVRQLAGRALGLAGASPKLHEAIERDLAAADRAARPTWLITFSPYWLLALLVTVGLTVLTPYCGVLIATVVAAYLYTHRVPTWRRNARAKRLVQKGL